MKDETLKLATYKMVVDYLNHSKKGKLETIINTFHKSIEFREKTPLDKLNKNCVMLEPTYLTAIGLIKNNYDNIEYISINTQNEACLIKIVFKIIGG